MWSGRRFGRPFTTGANSYHVRSRPSAGTQRTRSMTAVFTITAPPPDRPLGLPLIFIRVTTHFTIWAKDPARSSKVTKKRAGSRRPSQWRLHLTTGKCGRLRHMLVCRGNSIDIAMSASWSISFPGSQSIAPRLPKAARR
ncbi:hypothetical protein D3C80_1069680 [compost metagenome]